MPKAGSAYEDFVGRKFERLYPEAAGRVRDKLPGRISGIQREIDVSIRQTVVWVDLLYVVQCKDWETPTDINVLGEFNLTMQDVGAHKGFLMCTSGFAKTNHKAAAALGIELVTMDDIQSEQWHVDVQLPMVYRRNIPTFRLTFAVTANQQFVDRYYATGVELSLTTSTPLSTNAGVTARGLKQFIDEEIEARAADVADADQVDLLLPGLHALMASVWLPCSELAVEVIVAKEIYLRYVVPDEYSQLRDHVRNTTLPLHIKVNSVPLQLDGTYTRVQEGDLPAIGLTDLWIEAIEEPALEFDVQFSGAGGTFEIIEPADGGR